MPFSPITWVDDDGSGTVGTRVTAARMNRIETGVNDAHYPPLVSALPVTPADGEEIRFQTAAMAADGIVWHLRYRAGSSSTYKWEFVGGGWLADFQDADETFNTFSSNTWGGVSANDPQVTVPLAGDYLVDNRVGRFLTTAAASVALGVKVGATEPVNGINTAIGYNAVGSASASLSQVRKLTGVAASTLLVQRYYHNGGAGVNVTRGAASLGIQPVRVG